MGLGASRKYRQKVKAAGGGGRSAEDYGIPGLTDAQLRELAGNPGKYGEISGLASQEFQSRRGVQNQADMYRAALERATYQQLSPQFSQGLQQIQGQLAGAGPAADSGTGTALRSRLASQIYGQAQGQIGSGYASYLGNLLNQNRSYQQQRSLMQYQAKLNKPKPWDYIFGAAGGAGGAYFGRGGGGGGGGGGGYQASDAYYS